jgi:hypothetical protein
MTFGPWLCFGTNGLEIKFVAVLMLEFLGHCNSSAWSKYLTWQAKQSSSAVSVHLVTRNMK